MGTVMRFTAAIIVGLAFLFSTAVAKASSCGNQIAAFERYLDRVDATAPGSQTISGGVRMSKAKLILDDAKEADQRGDAKACRANVENAKQETGAAP
jgi:hypothetical protein